MFDLKINSEAEAENPNDAEIQASKSSGDAMTSEAVPAVAQEQQQSAQLVSQEGVVSHFSLSS